MPQVTDIEVVGSAHDVRTPDRAEVRLQISKWGRDWDAIHRGVTVATDSIVEALKRLGAVYPGALFEHTVSRISQRTWTDDIGSAYSETIEIAAIFADFQVMSQWLFAQSPELLHIHSIAWKLSPEAKKEVSALLTMEAIGDARRKAESLAAAAGLTIIGLKTLTDSNMSEPTANPRALTHPAAMISTPVEREVDINLVPMETSLQLKAHYLAEPESIPFDPHFLAAREPTDFAMSDVPTPSFL